MNVINGGAHADNNMDFQESMLVPHGFDTFGEALRAGVETFHVLKKLLKEQGKATSVGDEGGFAPDLASNAEALELLTQGDRDRRLQTGGADQPRTRRGRVGVLRQDAKKTYRLAGEGGRELDSAGLVDLYADLVGKFPLVSIEDGMNEEDWDGWKALTDRIGDEGPAGRRRPVRDQHQPGSSGGSTPASLTRCW